MPMDDAPNLTPEARRLWDGLTGEERRQLIEVAWCGYCIGPGPMRPIAGYVKQGRLVIEGPCLRCQNAMVRIADPRPPKSKERPAVKRRARHPFGAAVALGLALFAVPSRGIAAYHVSPAGSDENPGDAARPFRTIQRAATLMQAGDQTVVHAGTYRETVRPANSGEAGRPLRFVAAPGEEVIVTGCESLTGWRPAGDGVFAAACTDRVEQLFVDGRLMVSARFPNAGTNRWQIPTVRFVPQGAWLACDALDQPSNFWKGATLWGLSERLGWVAGTAPAVASSNGAVRMASEKVFWYGGGSGRGFLSGVAGALDAEREWHQEGDTLRFRPPGGRDPNAMTVETACRRWGFDLSGRRFVEVAGFRLQACAMNLDGAEDCRLERLRVRWPSWRSNLRGGFNRDRSISITAEGLGLTLSGRRNVLRDSVIAYGMGDGVSIFGASNTVENCVIHDFNLSASDCAPVTCTGVGHVIRRCTLFNGGRSILVHRHLKRGAIVHNRLSNAGLLSNDLGMTYTYQTDGEGTTIAYNYVHHNLGRAPGNVGIYLDDMTRNHIIHHNVVWGVSEAMALNPPRSMGNLVYHNTLDGSNVSLGMSMSRPQDLTGTRFINNIFLNRLPSLLPNAEMGTNLFHGVDARFVDRAAGDYRLAPDSPALDAGVRLPPYNDGFTGKAPDLGAFERDQEPWPAGSSIPPAEWDLDPEWAIPPGHRGPCFVKPPQPKPAA